MLLDLSYLSYPLPPDIQRLYEAGDFARMDRVIRLRLDDPRVPETLKARLRVQTEWRMRFCAPIRIRRRRCSKS